MNINKKINQSLEYLKEHWKARRECQKFNWELRNADPNDVKFLANKFVKKAIKDVRLAQQQVDTFHKTDT